MAGFDREHGARDASPASRCGGRSPTISSGRSRRASCRRRRLPGEIEIADALRRQPPHRAARARGAERARPGARRARQRHLRRGAAHPLSDRPRTRFSEIVGASGRQAGGRLIGERDEAASEHVAAAAAAQAGHAAWSGSRSLRTPTAFRSASARPGCRRRAFPNAARVLSRRRARSRARWRISASPTTGAHEHARHGGDRRCGRRRAAAARARPAAARGRQRRRRRRTARRS